MISFPLSTGFTFKLSQRNCGKRKLHSLTLETSNLLVDDKVKETLVVLLFNGNLWFSKSWIDWSARMIKHVNLEKDQATRV